ncbi:MAG TPA: 2-C-methyl-D-erythritol 4-phosphate cytidylyltransferase [Clostridiales bacterium]|nr:2-C-methyl-D-erythritol 4-phosphate cytidylyltransferase [Clostridiales bacterium]
MIYAAVFASGRGTRMGGILPKQFLDYNGEPIIIHSIRAFADNKRIDKIFVAVPDDYIQYTKNLCHEYFESEIEIIAGGSTRNRTLLKFLHAIPCSDDDIIITHDAVRPNITSEIIDACVNSMKEYSASTTANKVVDSMIIADNNGNLENYLDRSRVYAVQTPQTFDLKTLNELTNRLSLEQLDEMTDCAAIFMHFEYKVGIVQGSSKNIKITYPEDLETH